MREISQLDAKRNGEFSRRTNFCPRRVQAITETCATVPDDRRRTTAPPSTTAADEKEGNRPAQPLRVSIVRSGGTTTRVRELWERNGKRAYSHHEFGRPRLSALLLRRGAVLYPRWFGVVSRDMHVNDNQFHSSLSDTWYDGWISNWLVRLFQV